MKEKYLQESLLGMNITLWSRPRTGVYGASQCFVIDILPLDGQRDGIFRVHALPLGHARRARGRHPNGSRDPGKRPLAPIDVVGVEVIRNIRRLARPGLEGFQLVLWLTHVRIHVLEIAKTTPDSITGIRIKWIEAFVNLDADQNSLFGGSLC